MRKMRLYMWINGGLGEMGINKMMKHRWYWKLVCVSYHAIFIYVGLIWSDLSQADSGCDIERGSRCTYHPGSVHCVRAIQPRYKR